MDGKTPIGNMRKQIAALEEECLDDSVSKAIFRQNVQTKVHTQALKAFASGFLN